ncbi:MAG: tetratricopeptide repeat protein [Crocosphaera sp.]
MESYETWFEKGLTLQQQGKYEESLNCFQKTIELNDNFIPAWIYQGISLEKLQRYKAAILCYDEAIKINPNTADLWYNKGTIYCKIKQYHNALTCFEKVRTIEPDHALARTVQSLISAIPVKFDPLPKKDKKYKDDEEERAAEAKLYYQRSLEEVAYKMNSGEAEMGMDY